MTDLMILLGISDILLLGMIIGVAMEAGRDKDD
jgi:hypothetical protein